MDNKDLGRSADADGLSSLLDPAPTGLAHSASIPSADVPGAEYILAGEDGVFVFWPEAGGGAYNAGVLRAVARELERLNEGVFARWEQRYASAIEARSGETVGLDPKGESATNEVGDAQGGA